jgi:hypothetical protein
MINLHESTINDIISYITVYEHLERLATVLTWIRTPRMLVRKIKVKPITRNPYDYTGYNALMDYKIAGRVYPNVEEINVSCYFETRLDGSKTMDLVKEIITDPRVRNLSVRIEINDFYEPTDEQCKEWLYDTLILPYVTEKSKEYGFRFKLKIISSLYKPNIFRLSYGKFSEYRTLSRSMYRELSEEMNRGLAIYVRRNKAKK